MVNGVARMGARWAVAIGPVAPQGHGVDPGLALPKRWASAGMVEVPQPARTARPLRSELAAMAG